MVRLYKLLLALALGAGSGCYCVDTGRSPVLGKDVVEHVVISNYGWTLFGCVPLVCGNRNDSWCPFAFFRNDIKPEYAHEKLHRIAAEKGCDLKDVSLVTDNNVLFDAYYMQIPWILVYKETDLSANLVRKGTK